ncbi:hypothetical protein MLD38_000960 [Melastoma candidum]|uniref:Uncharacterized protein n=1 Tax=Melastoma candidum TaxID=119954 RepID=A0ACB9SBT7_9MYRT|nr:hypothetical protein MLD38_000960 [Melastoma candidum]
MDFGLDGLVASDPDSAPDAPPDPPGAEPRSVGSGPSKQLGRRPSGASPVMGDEEWRSSKLIRSTEDFSVPKAMPRDGTGSNAAGSSSLFSDGHHQQHMLSFSSSSSSPAKSEARQNPQSSYALPYLGYSPSSYNSFAGLGSGNQNGGNMQQMQGALNGTRGPFTPSQWIELEHQALIYKYITANIPIPSNLLLPIKKAFDSAGFSCYPGAYLRSNSLGWGSFYLGFSNTGDPEPGRCRRTDGKKWRCSRDAVADQKYCEKHMNRGRHRSRKPVEGQNGHSVAGTVATSASLKKMSAVSSASAAGPMVTAAVVTGGDASNSIAAMAHNQQQIKSLHSSLLSADPTQKRFFVHQESVNVKKQNPYLTMKQQMAFEDTSRLQFGIDNLLDCRGFAPSQDLGSIPETDATRGLFHQFIDDWPENSVDRSAASWSGTHLSISIPMASSGLISATSSPTIDRANLSPLRLSQKSDPLYMNRGLVGTAFGEPTHRQNISWESSMGGPLGEVLHNTSSTTSWGETKNSALLNLMKDGWDNSPSIVSSPTGVLQKTTFRSLSNSSAGSSPRAENKFMDGMINGSCNEHLGSTLVNSSLPAL